MKNNIYTILGVCFCFLLSNCSDDFLTNTPIMGNTDDVFYSSDDQMYAALMGAYNMLGTDDALANFVPFGEIRSDNAKTGGGKSTDQFDMQQMEDFTNSNVNYISKGIWKRSYWGIYRCNLVINSEYESDEAKVYKAEAKFLRAWYHWDALRTYGPCPISLESVYPEEHQFVRSTREEVNLQIEKDLLEAIPVLAEEHSKEQIGRATKSAAQGLLAKAYIYWADWANDDKAIFDKATDLLEEIMGNGKYKLFTDFEELFGPHQENNSESLFEIQRSTQSGNYKLGNYWVQFCGPRNLGNHPTIQSGWGLWLPQQNLYDYFMEEDSIRRNTALLTYDDLVTEPNKTLADDKQVTWNTTSINAEDFAGLEQGKYRNWNKKVYTVVGNLNRNRPGNDRILRYGEVYLLLAECYMRGTTKDEGKAKQLLNDLRKAHVGGGDASKCLSVDEMMAKFPNRFPNLLEVLWYERRCELAGEGDRWYDLVRTGRAAEVMGALYPSTWSDKHYYIPISEVETGASGNTLTTYPEEPVPTPPIY